jgi:hypothetical protein
MDNRSRAIAAAALVLAGLTLQSAPASAHAATACIQQTVAAAAKAGVETDAEEKSLLAFAPTRERLSPLLAQMIACVARVLPEQKDIADKNGGVPQHFWYRTETKEYCRSTNGIDTLGGTSDKKTYQSFFLVCAGGQ